MFTGITEEMGSIQATGESNLTIIAGVTLEGMRVGDSISVNGACLTITSLSDKRFTVDVTPETLRRTNLGVLKAKDPVNLERPVPLGGRLGGHIAQGHVDATGTVLSARHEGDSLLMRFGAPASVTRYVVEKGFIAVDGVSLTIVDQDASSFSVSVIPFTQEHTNLGARKSGDLVNLEVDILAKYVEAMLQQGDYLKGK